MTQTTTLTFPLNDGRVIPAIGLGTWQSKPDEVRDAVAFALKNGYRLIDTALNYGNEKEVGEGIRASSVPREQIYVTTKLNNPWHNRVCEGFKLQVSDLGIDYNFPCSTDALDLTSTCPAGIMLTPNTFIIHASNIYAS